MEPVEGRHPRLDVKVIPDERRVLVQNGQEMVAMPDNARCPAPPQGGFPASASASRYCLTCAAVSQLCHSDCQAALEPGRSQRRNAPLRPRPPSPCGYRRGRVGPARRGGCSIVRVNCGKNSMSRSSFRCACLMNEALSSQASRAEVRGDHRRSGGIVRRCPHRLLVHAGLGKRPSDRDALGDLEARYAGGQEILRRLRIGSGLKLKMRPVA